MSELRPGDRVHGVLSGIECKVEHSFAEGGQGTVFLVRSPDRTHALKWYNNTMLSVDRGLRQRLLRMIDSGPPSNKFLWPYELATDSRGNGLGYLMPVRGDGYREVQDLVGETVSASFRTLTRTSFEIASAFLALHAKGFSYRDISAGNLFFHPETGDVQICDNDNVDIDGLASVMKGLRGYQAPELVLGQAVPSRDTDLYALSVLLFRILLIGHPLEGKRALEYDNATNEDAFRQLHGVSPRFVFDPADASNAPDPHWHQPVLAHWAIYPDFLKGLFREAFTRGLFDPRNGRVSETRWCATMSQLHDAIMSCPHCGAENFYDPGRMTRSNPQPTFRCWNEACGAQLQSGPARIGLRRTNASRAEAPQHIVVLMPGARLYPHHTSGGEIDFSARSGEVLAAPLRLRNLSARPWRVEGTEDGARHIEPGDEVVLASGMRIVFDGMQGEVKL